MSWDDGAIPLGICGVAPVGGEDGEVRTALGWHNGVIRWWSRGTGGPLTFTNIDADFHSRSARFDFRKDSVEMVVDDRDANLGSFITFSLGKLDAFMFEFATDFFLIRDTSVGEMVFSAANGEFANVARVDGARSFDSGFRTEGNDSCESSEGEDDKDEECLRKHGLDFK